MLYSIYITLKSTQQIHRFPDCVGKYIRVKISGDGAKFSRSSNYVLLSFSLLNMGSQVLSDSGMLIKKIGCVCIKISMHNYIHHRQSHRSRCETG